MERIYCIILSLPYRRQQKTVLEKEWKHIILYVMENTSGNKQTTTKMLKAQCYPLWKSSTKVFCGIIFDRIFPENGITIAIGIYIAAIENGFEWQSMVFHLNDQTHKKTHKHITVCEWIEFVIGKLSACMSWVNENFMATMKTYNLFMF